MKTITLTREEFMKKANEAILKEGNLVHHALTSDNANGGATSALLLSSMAFITEVAQHLFNDEQEEMPKDNPFMRTEG